MEVISISDYLKLKKDYETLNEHYQKLEEENKTLKKDLEDKDKIIQDKENIIIEREKAIDRLYNDNTDLKYYVNKVKSEQLDYMKLKELLRRIIK